MKAVELKEGNFVDVDFKALKKKSKAKKEFKGNKESKIKKEFKSKKENKPKDK